MGKFVDLSNKKFGKWTVIRHIIKQKGKTHWLCKCECGLESLVNSAHLLGNRSTKCKTCHNKNAVKKRPLKHGNCINKNTKEYSCWSSMRTRCLNPNDEHWENYGKRGIKVCQEWNDFSVFLKDMGKRPINHTIDRIDVNGDYCPENCRWVTIQTQCENKRNNVILELNGERKTKTRWAREYKIPYTSFSRMIKKLGWPLSFPPNQDSSK